jgi:predicted DNA-binding protein
MGTLTARKTILTIRAPRELAERVRAIARHESESDSTILRRLLRRGLELEQHSVKAEAHQ